MREPGSRSTGEGVSEGRAARASGGGRRALALAAALACGFLAAVMVAVVIDVGGLQACEELRAAGGGGECFEGSQTAKTAVLVLGWPGGIALALATLGALAFAATGRRGRLVLQVAGTGIALSAASILVGSL